MLILKEKIFIKTPFDNEDALMIKKKIGLREWFNFYKKVNINLTTHEAGVITERDFEFAKKIEEIALKNRRESYGEKKRKTRWKEKPGNYLLPGQGD